MARALLMVRHPVTEYGKWRAVYDEVQTLRDEYGCTGDEVWHAPDDDNDVTALHWFPSVDQAQGFAGSQELKDAMGRAGVSGPPRIEIVTEA